MDRILEQLHLTARVFCLAVVFYVLACIVSFLFSCPSSTSFVWLELHNNYNADGTVKGWKLYHSSEFDCARGDAIRSALASYIKFNHKSEYFYGHLVKLLMLNSASVHDMRSRDGTVYYFKLHCDGLAEEPILNITSSRIQICKNFVCDVTMTIKNCVEKNTETHLHTLGNSINSLIGFG